MKLEIGCQGEDKGVNRMDVYQNLAKHLDDLPAGFPATDSGVELRILKRLFTEDEAEIAVGLKMFPERVSTIAGRLGRDEEELAERLKTMAGKGLVFRSSKGKSPHYMAAQFVVGIWEYHLNDLDPELIRDMNEYAPHLFKAMWSESETKQLRVIPVSESLEQELAVMDYEAAEEIIKRQSKIVVAECICRKEHRMIGQGCDFPLEACFVFGSGAYFYLENGLGREVSTEEALELFHNGVAAGLVVQPGNAQKPANICMCCGCCCQILKNVKNLDKPAELVHTNHYARVDDDKCVACGVCVERCHMEAITLEEAARVEQERCIGCGVCLLGCEYEAITLCRKEAEDLYTPPKSMFDTYAGMAREREK